MILLLSVNQACKFAVESKFYLISGLLLSAMFGLLFICLLKWGKLNMHCLTTVTTNIICYDHI